MIELIILPDRTISVDVVGAFADELSAELTEYPVEDGSPRSDHKVRKLDTLTLEITQTEHPLDDPQYSPLDLVLSYGTPSVRRRQTELKLPPARGMITSPILLIESGLKSLFAGEAIPVQVPALETANTLQRSVSLDTLQTPTPRDRGAELYESLAALLGDELATISYRGTTRSRMSLIGLTRTFEPGRTLLQCTFKELRTSKIERVQLPDPAELAAKSAVSKGKAGSQEKKAPDKPKSVLKSMYD